MRWSLQMPDETKLNQEDEWMDGCMDGHWALTRTIIYLSSKSNVNSRQNNLESNGEHKWQGTLQIFSTVFLQFKIRF